MRAVQCEHHPLYHGSKIGKIMSKSDFKPNIDKYRSQPFLPEQPDRSIRDQETLIQYVLGPEGHKAFQKLLEDASPYSDLPPNLD
jgi:hypothetical protein